MVVSQYRSHFLALGFLCCALPSPVLAACELSRNILQDQDGNEARVVSVKECFGWFDRDDPDLSSANDKCFNEREASKGIKKLAARYKHSAQIVGTRLITISYKKRFHTIAETAIVGSPWLSYEVDPDLRSVTVDKFKGSAGVYQLLDGDIQFDFTPEAPPGFDTPEGLYKSLLGVQFIYKRCE